MHAAARPRRTDWIADWGIRVALLLGVTGALAQFVAYRFDLDRAALDSSADGGVFGALGVIVFAAAVAAAWLLAIVSRRLRTQALVCALLISGVLVLEVSDLPHSRLLAAPLGAAAIVLLLRLGRGDEAAGRLLRAGCIVLVIAFLGHALGAWLVSELNQGSDSWLYQVKVVVKHGGELVGWTLVAAGLGALLHARA